MTVNRKKISLVANRYAGALFDLSLGANMVEKVGNDLQKLYNLIENVSELRYFIDSPLYSVDDQNKALAVICKTLGIKGLVSNFIGLIIKNRRLADFPDMVMAYMKFSSDARGEVEAQVTCADAMSPKQIADLRTSLAGAEGRDVKLDVKIDPSILGGLIIRLGSRLFDDSLKTKLQNLKIAMKGTA